MRQLFLFIFIFGFYGISRGQSITKIENNFARLVDKVGDWAAKYDKDADWTDSVAFYNKKAVRYLLKVCNEVPGTLDAKFTSFDSVWRTGITTAEDGNVRIYDWDDYEGGTMRSYNSVIQYRVGAGVKAMELCTSIRNKGRKEFCPTFFDLHSIQTPDGTVYVVSKLFLYASAMGSQEVAAFKIEGDSINWNIPFFKTQTKLLNSVFFEYEMSKALNKEYQGMCFVEWDPKKGIFYIPVITKEMKITGKYFRYKFDGNYFVYDSIVNYKEVPIKK